MADGISYITKYIITYDTGVPLVILISVSAIMLIGVVVLFVTRTGHKMFVRNSSRWLLAGYAFLVLCTTVLFRHDTGEMLYRLSPLWSYRPLYSRLLAEHILNIAMFVPIGFLVGGGMVKKDVRKIALIGCLLSLSIELTQLLFRLGVCNIDDVLHNTIGCLIGYGLFLLFNRLVNNKVKYSSL